MNGESQRLKIEDSPINSLLLIIFILIPQKFANFNSRTNIFLNILAHLHDTFNIIFNSFSHFPCFIFDILRNIFIPFFSIRLECGFPLFLFGFVGFTD